MLFRLHDFRLIACSLAALCLLTLSVRAAANPSFNLDKVLDRSHLMPKGAHYDATVPDTLDLAERARLSVQGLTSFLNAQANYAPYGHAYFNANPPYMSDLPGGPPNWGKIAESLVLARLMCGSSENLDIEAATLRGMLSPPVERSGGGAAYSADYMAINPAAPTPLSRVMLALMAVYEQAPNSELKRLIDQMADSHVRAAKYQGDLAYYTDPPPDTHETSLGVLGHWLPVFIQGCAIRALTRWSELRGDRNGDGKYLDTAGKLVNFLVQDKFWVAEAGPKAVAGAQRGHFSGHAHAYTQALMGLLCYASARNDARLKEFVRSSYEYLRNFGIARIGLFGEGCATGDMTWLAIQFGVAQVNLLLNRASPWLDVDSYLPFEGKVVIRNKSARKIAVRMPGWVDASAVQSKIKGRAAAPFRVGRYLIWNDVRRGAEITITFPVVETTETHVLKWKQAEFWKESTHPGPSWQPAKEPRQHVCRFRGNTLVEITPRDPGPGYPLYLREEMKATNAPMKRVSRFISVNPASSPKRRDR